MSLLKTRYEIATILGYSNWADYNAADKMIAKGQNIGDFIKSVNDAARPLADQEFKMLLAEKQKTNPEAKEVFDYQVELLRGNGSAFAIQLRFAVSAALFSLPASEAGHPGRSQ